MPAAGGAAGRLAGVQRASAELAAAAVHSSQCSQADCIPGSLPLHAASRLSALSLLGCQPEARVRSCVPPECATAAPCSSQPPRQSAPARQLAALGGGISLDSGSSLVPFAMAGLRPIPFPIHPRATAPGAASRRRGCGRVAWQARAAGRSAAAGLFCVTPPVAFAHVSFAVLRHPLLCPSAFPTPPARSALPALPLLGGSLPLPDLHLCRCPSWALLDAVHDLRSRPWVSRVVPRPCDALRSLLAVALDSFDVAVGSTGLC